MSNIGFTVKYFATNFVLYIYIYIYIYSLGTEEKRGTTFRSSTDEIFEALTRDKKVG